MSIQVAITFSASGYIKQNVIITKKGLTPAKLESLPPNYSCTNQTMNITTAAKNFVQAKNAYEKAFNEYFENLQPLPIPRFWTLLEGFQKLVFGPMFKNPIDELFRRPQAEGFTTGGIKTFPYSFKEATQFANNWRKLKDELYQPLFNVIQDRSDDSYGDLLDALPLAGQTVVDNCLKKQYNYEDFCDAVKIVHPKAEKIILHGENYFGMLLKEEARRRYVYEI